MEDLERKHFYILAKKGLNQNVYVEGIKAKSYSNIKSVHLDRIYFNHLCIFNNKNGEIIKEITIDTFIKNYIETNIYKEIYFNFFDK